MDLKIPDRWLACPQRSQLMTGKFVVFKTPLDAQFDAKVGKQKFNFDILHKSLEENKLRLKMVVDMTFTDRYYNPKQLTDRNIHYVKLKCRGTEEAPDRESKERFVQEVDKFKGGEGDVIGVHCTHGFNRSGFMIVSYLVEQYDFCLDSAIVEFTKARFPGIYKEDYVKKLCEIYSMDREDVPPITSNLPSWVTDKDSNDHPEIYNSTKRFMDGMVPGVDTVIDTATVLAVQKAVQKICEWKMSGFPGGQPVSLSKKNIQKLAEMEYRVSWKADGTRFLMYIEKESEVYLLDRDNTVFKPRCLKFPWKEGHLYDTLLDGELVIDKYQQGQYIPRFLAYDIIKMQEDQIGEKPLDHRQGCIRNIVNERDKRVDKTKEAFSVKIKEFYDVKYSERLMSPRFLQGLHHETDGLIYQPAKKPYTTGQSEDILKWKPPGLNSVDFRMKIEVERKEGCPIVKVANLYCSNTKVYQFKYTKELKDMDNKIIECHWEAAGKFWKFMRERTDKSFPNAYETYMSICQTIHEPVSQESLVSFITKKRSAPVDLPPSKKHKSMK